MAYVIWRFSDGKAGHDSQSRGLVNALSECVSIEEYRLPVAPGGRVWWWWLSKRYPAGAGLPTPDLLIGAGHATHPHLLAARRARGGRSIVLMQPSLPRAWFDLCVVPEHDRAEPGANLIATHGVLNAVRPGGEHDTDVGLIVLGGPSRHFDWDSKDMLEQIDELVRQRPKRHWWLTTSRRTPDSLVGELQQLVSVRCVTFSQSTPQWLSARLAEAGEVWVTEDSVSMIYESLSAGARVGLLEVPRLKPGRVSRGVDKLVSDGWVGAPRQWTLAAGPGHTLNEAARCAGWISRQWLSAP